MKYSIIRNILAVGIVAMLTASCTKPSSWVSDQSFPIDAGPIGLTSVDNHLWIADGDNNRLLKYTYDGVLSDSLINFDRPMHIDSDEADIYVPEYGADKLTRLSSSLRDTVSLPFKLSAPSAVSVFKGEKAIADFYNHRILYFNGDKWLSIGAEGHEAGLFYYPTDVYITPELIYVADAYNNRVQTFDKEGHHQKVLGSELAMNASTGLTVTDEEVIITDFENSRVVILDHKGKLRQELHDGLDKPTDVIVIGDTLYITNYKARTLSRFIKK